MLALKIGKLYLEMSCIDIFLHEFQFQKDNFGFFDTMDY